MSKYGTAYSGLLYCILEIHFVLCTLCHRKADHKLMAITLSKLENLLGSDKVVTISCVIIFNFLEDTCI